MPDRPIKLRDLRRILARYGCWEDASLGKGSHTTFLRTIDGVVWKYPVPTHGRDMIGIGYVKLIRKRFRLTRADGIADGDFYA